jgi:hypothetical protein
LATDFDLWCSFVRFENAVSEREFGAMSVDEKLDILRGMLRLRDPRSTKPTFRRTKQMTIKSRIFPDQVLVRR